MNGLPSLFDATTVPILQEVLRFTEARHEVLAGNIANLDTPGYRVRDLSLESFQQRLKEAIEARRQAAGPGAVSPGVVWDPRDEAMRRVRETMTSVLYHDDSNVGWEQQVAEIAKNQILHNLAVSLMSSQFRLLQAVISERV